MSTATAIRPTPILELTAATVRLRRALDLPERDGDRLALQTLATLPGDVADRLWADIRDDHRHLNEAIAWTDDPYGFGHRIDALNTTDAFYVGTDGAADLDCVAAASHAVDVWEQRLYLSINAAARQATDRRHDRIAAAR